MIFFFKKKKTRLSGTGLIISVSGARHQETQNAALLGDELKWSGCITTIVGLVPSIPTWDLGLVKHVLGIKVPTYSFTYWRKRSTDYLTYVCTPCPASSVPLFPGGRDPTEPLHYSTLPAAWPGVAHTCKLSTHIHMYTYLIIPGVIPLNSNYCWLVSCEASQGPVCLIPAWTSVLWNSAGFSTAGNQVHKWLGWHKPSWRLYLLSVWIGK